MTTAFRFFYCTWLPILPDEAYYFQWSRHLDASYFSKGPAVAYTIAAGTALFGANNLGVRFFAVMLSAGTAWQMFLLARRWYDETTALIAVLITGVVPLYALGAVVMTIDPLSAFFWIWAANLFSRAVQEERLLDWLLTGFAVGCGFLAKYLNALELVAFLAFLLLIPDAPSLAREAPFLADAGRRGALHDAGLLVELAARLGQRKTAWRIADISTGRFELHLSTFLDFLGLQALVISPLLFLALLMTAAVVCVRRFRRKASHESTKASFFSCFSFFRFS